MQFDGLRCKCCISDQHRRSGGQRCCTTTGARGPIIEDTVLSTSIGSLVTEDIASTVIVGNLVIGVTTLIAGFSGLVIGVEILVFVVCLKNFTCHTKYLKIFNNQILKKKANKITKSNIFKLIKWTKWRVATIHSHCFLKLMNQIQIIFMRRIFNFSDITQFIIFMSCHN